MTERELILEELLKAADRFVAGHPHGPVGTGARAVVEKLAAVVREDERDLQRLRARVEELEGELAEANARISEHECPDCGDRPGGEE